MELPEFRIALTRLAPGESAYPIVEDERYEEYLGQRSKLGGKPDLAFGERELPKCPQCDQEMVFVAQIDSIEHDSPSNPHAVNSGSEDQKWMFADVGMIYVFYCFECIHADAFADFY